MTLYVDSAFLHDIRKFTYPVRSKQIYQPVWRIYYALESGLFLFPWKVSETGTTHTCCAYAAIAKQAGTYSMPDDLTKNVQRSAKSL